MQMWRCNMKILTKKKVDEILKRITANKIIAIKYITIPEANGVFSENSSEIAYLVGGIKGMCKVQNTIKSRYVKAGGVE